MKRTTIWLPEDLADRLTVESARTGIKAAELIRRAVAAVTPPIRASAGELRKRIDRAGILNVFVLDARDGQLLVEPGGGFEGLFESTVQIWVPANLVTFPETAESIPGPLLNRSILETPPELRLNLIAAAPEKSHTADLPRMNVHPMPEEQKRVLLDRAAKEILDFQGVEARPESSPAPVPTRCGICKELFPSKAAKKRHVRDAHSTPPTTGEKPQS